MTLSSQLRALVGGFRLVLALTLACTSTEVERPSKERALVASPASPLPKGLVCGLSYTQSTDELSVQFTGGTFVRVNYNNDFLGGGFDFGLPDVPVSVSNTTVHNAWRGSCNNVPTLDWCFGGGPLLGGYGPYVWHCHATATPQEGYEFHVAVDAGDAFRAWDNGAPGGQTSPGPWGFSYQAYVGTPSLPAATGPAASDRFVLPKGTACGLAHTNNGAVQNKGYANNDPTCMGYNPLAPDISQRCPAGWVSRYMFDMSSGNGSRCDLGLFSQPGCGFWAWCEYQDPHNLCDGKCLEDAVASGVALNLQSDTDASGAAWCSRGDSPGSPGCTCYGGSQSPFFDQGRGSGDGLSWCGNFSLTRESGSSAFDDYPSYCSGLATACNSWNLVPLTGPIFTSQGVYCEQPCTGYVGCFADNPSRVLPYFAGSGFTVDSCQQAGYNLGFRYAGVEYGGQCFLGNNLDGVSQIGQTPSCGMSCSANTSEICGGSWALSVYYSSNAPPQVAMLSAAASAAIDVPSAVQLQWAAPIGTSTGYTPTSYNVYRGQFSNVPGVLSWSKIASTTTTSFLVPNLPDGTQYFNVSAVDAAGEGRMSRNGVTAAAEHCDQATCPTGCCSGNSCLAGNVVSTGCATNGNVCAAPCPGGYTCTSGICQAPCAPRTCSRGYIWDPDLCRCENTRL